MIHLLLALALTAPICRDRTCFRPRNASTSVASAFFAFAPLSGAGMGAACACTTPTGAKGEVMTFTRASSATCLKTVGVSPQLIANGDMVTCASGQPRVMPGPDGTSVNKLLNEAAGTNNILRSQEFDNVAWSTTQSGAAAPVITANAATAPDGTVTAERIQFPATSGVQFSVVFQSYAGGAAAARAGILFVRGNAQSGTLNFRFTDGTTNFVFGCPYVASSWTLCSGVTPATLANTIFHEFGGVAGLGGGVSNSANDVFVWGADMKNADHVTSYVATTSAVATRVAEVASFPLTLSGGTASFAATYLAPSVLGSNALLHVYKDANNSLELSVASSKARGTFRQGGVSSTQDSAGSLTVSASNRLAAYYDLTNKAGCLAGTCATGAASLTLETGSNTLYLGADQAGANAIDGLIGQVAYDPSPTRAQ